MSFELSLGQERPLTPLRNSSAANEASQLPGSAQGSCGGLPGFDHGLGKRRAKLLLQPWDPVNPSPE